MDAVSPAKSKLTPFIAATVAFLSAAFHPLLTLGGGGRFLNVGYGDQPLPASLGPLRQISWALVTLGAVAITFVTFDQIRLALISKAYGIRVSWGALLVMLVVILALEIAAFLAARSRHYGLATCCAGFVVVSLGGLMLFELAQVGM